MNAPAGGRLAVEAEELGKRYGGQRALEGVSFALAPGECLALFGPNGAGKTTLLRVLAGLVKPTSGRASIDGISLPGGAAARARVGLISHQSMLYGALTARENVEFAARMYGVADPRRAAIAALDRMKVADRAEAAVRVLSRGLQQRVSIARAMVHDPALLLLDEPFTGLDETGAAALSGALSELRARGATMVLVTHNIAEGLSLATHAAIMKAGRLARWERRDALNTEAYAVAYRELVSGAA